VGNVFGGGRRDGFHDLRVGNYHRFAQERRGLAVSLAAVIGPGADRRDDDKDRDQARDEEPAVGLDAGKDVVKGIGDLVVLEAMAFGSLHGGARLSPLKHTSLT
jgi:hypothetical protein